MILLSVLGILVVGSASNQDRSSVIKQIIGVVVSLIICLVLSLIDYHQYFRFTTLIYVVCAWNAGGSSFVWTYHQGRDPLAADRRDSDPAVRVCKDRSDPHPGEFSFQKPG